MENLLGEMMLGGLGIVIVILSFTRWTRDRAVTLGIGGWFLALALALVFEKALLFTILLGSRSAWLPCGGSAQVAAFAKGETRGIGRILKKYHVDIVRHSTDVYAGHGMERIGNMRLLIKHESVFMDRFL